MLANLIGIGDTSGIGAKQALLAIAGLVLLVGGLVMLTPAGQAYLRDTGPPPPEVPETSSWAILFTVWAGLVAALPELSLILIQKLLGHRFLGLSTHAAWLTPIPFVVLFLACTTILALVAAFGPRRALHLRTMAFVFGFFTAFSALLLFHPAIHVIAIAVLAAGIASVLAKLARRHRVGLHRLVRRTIIPLVLMIVVTGVAVPAVQRVSERRITNALPAPLASAPNVLLIILDTVRWANLSAYGYGRPTTPWLEGVAQGGVLFENAYSTAPWTLPSHASIFTGFYARDVTAGWETPLDDEHPTLAEIFRDRGYRTAGFVGNRLYAGPHSGLGRGFLRYDSDVISVSEVFGSFSLGRYLGDQAWFRDLTGFRDMLGRKDAEAVSAEFLSWLDGTDERPFFVFLNYYDAHDPYLPDAPFEGQFRTTDRKCVPADISAGSLRTEDELVQCVDAYDGAIAQLDAHLDELFAVLEEAGRLSNTLVVITSDHGEEFGEHGLTNHGRSLYMAALRVPLIVSFPGRIPGGVSLGAPVSVRDIPATVLDLARVGATDIVPGSSLARFWDEVEVTLDASDSTRAELPLLADTSGREWLADHNPVSRGDMRSLIAGGFHYILNGDGIEELYQISTDPWEHLDLSERPDHAADLARFRAAMDALDRDGSVSD